MTVMLPFRARAELTDQPSRHPDNASTIDEGNGQIKPRKQGHATRRQKN
jgi:hypothetical protein